MSYIRKAQDDQQASPPNANALTQRPIPPPDRNGSSTMSSTTMSSVYSCPLLEYSHLSFAIELY